MTSFDGEVEVVRAAYGRRAAEYVEVLGSLNAMSPLDRAAIEAWARDLRGRVVDAGCGPGHWTAHLRDLGVDIAGIDMVSEFIESARVRFPDTPFRLGKLDDLPIASGSLSGVLAWYSVIHAPPAQLPEILREFARCLEPGGSLLLGLFEGPETMPFDHAVTTAYFWPVSEMTCLLEEAGFEVVSVETRADPGVRPHASITARRLVWLECREQTLLVGQERGSAAATYFCGRSRTFEG